jgi:hypothetical protein
MLYRLRTQRIAQYFRCVQAADRMDVTDAQGRIDTNCRPAGGRAFAGSNPASPMSRKSAQRD